MAVNKQKGPKKKKPTVKKLEGSQKKKATKATLKKKIGVVKKPFFVLIDGPIGGQNAHSQLQ